MSLVAEYKLSCRALPLVDVAAAVPEMTLHVDVGQPNQGGPPPFDVRVAGDEFESLERAFEEAAFVREYSLVGGTDGSRRYQVIPAFTMSEQLGPAVNRPSKLEDLAENESIVEDVRVVPDGWVQTRWFADRDAFDEYCAFWRENGSSFALRRLSSSDGPPSGQLTDRQREALHTAYQMGYFEVPRGASLSDVADELDISPPSLSERLRRASAGLVENTVLREDGKKPLIN